VEWGETVVRCVGQVFGEGRGKGMEGGAGGGREGSIGRGREEEEGKGGEKGDK